MSQGHKNKLSRFFLYLSGILLIGFVIAAPSWSSSGTTTSFLEDQSPTFTYNFTNNVSNSQNETLVFEFINITKSPATGNSSPSYYTWISLDSSTGIMTLNASNDTLTGKYNMTVFVHNPTGQGQSDLFYFIVNATNDAPLFTSINSTYNLTQSDPLFEYINASDEESHYPLFFNITFLTNCSLASWSTRGAGNCSIFNFTNPVNSSVLMNFTPTRNDAGVYWANVSITDAGDQYSCPHEYCANSTYKQNKTTYYSSFIVFNVFSTLEVDVSNCTDKIFQESQSGLCFVNITTKGETDTLNISSYAALRNYASGQGGVVNTSWFYSNSSVNAVAFTKTITINVTPQKTEIGNWTINFTVNDVTHNENSTTPIYVRVNRSSNDIPDVISVSNLNTSINLETVINLSVYDDDLLVPDKNTSFGGFNESISFTATVLNSTNLSQVSLSSFSVTVLSMPVSGTNKTSAEIRFTPVSSDIGHYIVNISVSDVDAALDFTTFNMSIINNTAPQWLAPNTTIIGWEGNQTYLNLSSNVTDSDGDVLTFSYVSDNSFPSFSLGASTGVIDFTPIDTDIGQHIVNITISDGYLTAVKTFNVSIYNTEDNPVFSLLQATNATPTTISNGSSVNATEDNLTMLTLTLQDDDFRIPSGQKTFYNETLLVNLTIQGTNSSLFSFLDSGLVVDNQTQFTATFTPRKADLGNYNITINVTDASNFSTYMVFNISISAINHNPILSNLTNQTSGINRQLYYDLNVTDTEDGNDTSSTLNSNFTFSYSFLTGTDFINNNNTLFNRTTGILNITFNSSQAGQYRINVTVNDSSGLIDFDSFWVFVYGTPSISFPASGAILNLTENTTTILNFTVNHSLSDNLTYNFYVDSITYNGSYNYGNLILRNNLSYYGNGTNVSWSFTPNFTDETYGKFKNLTLVVYPSSSQISNNTLLNTTIDFNLNVSHTNYPIVFDGDISDKGPVSYSNDITIGLSDYFSDIDHTDYFYNQSVSFTVHSNTSSITSSVASDWTLTLSANTAVVGLVNVTGSDSSSNATSNSFLVQFTDPGVSTSDSPGGGGTRDVPVSLKILLPDPVSAFKKDRIVLPITLENDGSVALYGITLNGTVARNGTRVNNVSISFSKDSFSVLSVGQKEKLNLTVILDTTEVGLYEVTINADVDNPSYNDWGKLYLNVKEGESVREKILFTEEFIVSNPQCVELTEIVKEAKKYLDQGNEQMALNKSAEALAACKDLLSQAGKPGIRKIIENKLYRYLIIATLVAISAGIVYYSYRRMVLKRWRGSFVQQDIKNKKYLDYNH